MMSGKTSLALLASLLGSCSGPASASTADTGYISGIAQNNAGATYFTHSGPRSPLPSCANDPRWIIDSSNALGQNLMTTLFLAYKMGKTVSVAGTGTCYAGSNNETVGILFISP